MTIAEAVGLSQPAVADRVRKLEERGAILGYVARLDPRLLGNDIRALVGVRIAHPRHHDAFIRKILEVATRNTASLDELISDTLRRIPGVTRTHTTVVLSTVKEQTQVPLPAPSGGPRRRRKEAA